MIDPNIKYLDKVITASGMHQNKLVHKIEGTRRVIER